MDDPTSLLFGLDSFRVVDVVRVADRMLQIAIETVDTQGLCPDCGRPSTRMKDRTMALLLGLAPGRSGACVRTWLGEQSPQFRAGAGGRPELYVSLVDSAVWLVQVTVPGARWDA